MLGGDARRDRVQRGLRLTQRRTGSQAADDLKEVVAAGVQGAAGLEGEWHPHVAPSFGIANVARHDAYNRVRLSIDRHHPSDDGCIATEGAFAKSLADHRDAVRAVRAF